MVEDGSQVGLARVEAFTYTAELRSDHQAREGGPGQYLMLLTMVKNPDQRRVDRQTGGFGPDIKSASPWQGQEAQGSPTMAWHGRNWHSDGFEGDELTVEVWWPMDFPHTMDSGTSLFFDHRDPEAVVSLGRRIVA